MKAAPRASLTPGADETRLHSAPNRPGEACGNVPIFINSRAAQRRRKPPKTQEKCDIADTPDESCGVLA